MIITLKHTNELLIPIFIPTMVFTNRSLIFFTLFYCIFTVAHGYQCNSKEHQGPFLQLAEISGGLFNQWMNMHGNIYAALQWTRATNGTVILPRTAKTRESFLVKLVSMVPIPLGDLIDVEFLQSFLAQEGLRICQPSDDWFRDAGKWKTIYLPVRTTETNPGYNAERTLKEAKRLDLDTVDRNTIFVGTGNFGGVEIPFNVTDYFYPDLVMSRNAALSLRFASKIRELAGKVINSLREYAKGRFIIGIHLRLEADWDIASTEDATRYLDEYRIIVDAISRDISGGFVLYVSHAELPSNIRSVVENWLNNYEHVSKHNFLKQNDLKSVCLECQAAIDASVLTEVNNFIGCSFSSFSYIVSELRNYIGLPFEMMRKPGFPIFYPVYSPRKNNWSDKKSFDKESPSLSRSKLYSHIVGQKRFSRIAHRDVFDGQPTDKVSAHTYQIMYGIFLVPMAQKFKEDGNEKLRILEIGMGCNMFYGPGKSVAVWKRLLGKSGDIWVADNNATCVDSAVKNNQLQGVNPLSGDQSDRNVLKSWMKNSNGSFDVIIDDGGHSNEMIYTSFDVLFNNALAPGGLYFIEDMQVGRIHAPYNGIIMSDLIQAWTEQLIVPNRYVNGDKRSEALRVKYPIPPAVKWIFCQAEACVIAKCEFLEHAKCKPGDFK